MTGYAESMKKILAIVVLGLFLSSNTNANHYLGHDPNKKSSLDRAFESLEKGNNKKKQRQLERRIRQLELERKLKQKKTTKNLSVQERGVQIAKKGDAIIQFGVGKAFIEGSEGFETDVRQGVFWLEESAKQFFTPAMVYLGWIYYSGEDGKVQKDFKKSLQLTESASMLGHPLASYNLAFFFYHGQIGFDDNFEEAKKYFIISAEQYLKSYDKTKNKYCYNSVPQERTMGLFCHTLLSEEKSIREELNMLENKDLKMIKLKEKFLFFLKNPSAENLDNIKKVS